MTDHTPGPWTTDTDRCFKHDDSIGVRGPDQMFVAAAWDFNRYDREEEVKANARLIAAAPDLLAALERIVAINGSTGGHKAMVAEFKYIAEVAIAKARATKNS